MRNQNQGPISIEAKKYFSKVKTFFKKNFNNFVICLMFEKLKLWVLFKRGSYQWNYSIETYLIIEWQIFSECKMTHICQTFGKVNTT